MRKYGLILHKVIHNMHLCLCKSLHCFKTNEVFLGVANIKKTGGKKKRTPREIEKRV